MIPLGKGKFLRTLFDIDCNWHVVGLENVITKIMILK